MSDRIQGAARTLLRLTRPGRPERPSRLGRPELTQSQMELMPFVRQAEEEEDKERSRLRPLQFVFNLLQSGQYFSAGAAEEIRNSIRTGEPLGQAAADAVRAAFRGLGAGLTGRRPEGQASTFEEVFFGHKPKEERTFIEKAAGFLADVLLDPTTYISFGATGAARGAASKFAMLSTKTFAKKKGLGLVLDNIDDIAKARNLPNPLKRQLSEHYNQAFQQALRLPRGVDPEDFAQRLSTGLLEEAKSLRPRFSAGPSQGIVSGARVTSPIQLQGERGLETLIDEISRVASVNGFQGVGERAWRPLAFQFFKGVRTPSPVAPDTIIQTFKNRFKETGFGRTIGDAWWSMINGAPATNFGGKFRKLLGLPPQGLGVIGSLRKAFGVFDPPFEKVLRKEGRRLEQGFHSMAADGADMVNQIFPKEIEDQRMIDLTDALVTAHRETGKRKAFVSAEDLLREQGADEALIEAAGRYRIRNEQIKVQMDEMAANGTVDSAATDLNYIFKNVDPGEVYGQPGREVGVFAPGVTKRAQLDLGQHVEINKKRLQAIFGEETLEKAALENNMTVDQLLDDLLRNKGWGNIELDLRQIMTIRETIHARMLKRDQVIQGFREFGIPEGSYNPIFKGGIQELGVRPVSDPALKGYLFDSDMADIVDRFYDSTQTREGVMAMKKAWAWMTRWWKGWATATPRFHIRNAMSNNMTGFLKHGPRWLNLVEHVDATVASTYALHKDRYVDLLTGEFKLSRPKIEAILNKRIGNQTLREWADRARRDGVISHRTFFSEDVTAGAVTDLAASTGKVRENVVFRASRAFGDVIENQSRFMSYMLDLKKGEGLEGAAEYAAMEAKKWFIDYGDLTDFEQRILRPIIPFYTWMRKNLANQMSGLLLHGDLYSIVPKGQRAVQSFAGVDDDEFDYTLLEDWQRNLGLFPTWHDPKKEKSVLFDPFFAYQDLNTIPLFFEPGNPLPQVSLREFMAEIGAASHPVIKTIAELTFGKDIFRRRDIKDMEIAPTIIQAFREKPEVINFLDGFMRLGGHEEGTKMDIDERGVVVMDGTVQRILENNIPALRTIGSIYEIFDATAGVASEGLSDVLNQVNEERDYDAAYSKMLRGLSFLAGAKFRQFDIEEAREKRAREIRAEAQRRRSQEKRNLPGFEQRSEAARERDLRSLRNLELL